MFFLCKYQDLLKKSVKTCNILIENTNYSIILVAKDHQIHAFRNQCPHAWVGLDAVDDLIISGCGQYLQCTSHFAQFRMHDGYCVYGPCAGQSLVPLQLTIKDGSIFLLQAV